MAKQGHQVEQDACYVAMYNYKLNKHVNATMSQAYDNEIDELKERYPLLNCFMDKDSPRLFACKEISFVVANKAQEPRL
jgi:hypothetical protein